MESSEVMSNSAESCNGGSIQLSNDVKENDNLDVDLLEDLDSYWQDINDRLIISRMVSDSVIKGIVNAVTQETEEKIADKELEVTKLKEMLHVYHEGVDDNELLGSSAIHPESNRLTRKGTKDTMHPSFLEAVVEHDRVEDSLNSLRAETKDQFKKLKKEIDSIRGCSSVKRIGSSSQLGLCDILQDKVADRWIDVDRSLDNLNCTLETVYQHVEVMVSSSKASVCEWQQEQEFKAEIEALVMRNCIWSVEEKNWNQFYGDKNLNWHGRMKKLSSLREEVDTISKLLSVSDIGHLSSHGSLEGDEENNSYKKGERSQRKVFSSLKSSPSSSLISSSTLASTTTSTSSASSSHGEDNGKHDELEMSIQENLDAARLTHMSRDELIHHYNHEITKLKRNHESVVQDIIEEKFSLRRELLREKGSSLSSKKSKEFDMLRKSMSEVITKLDEVLVEKEEVDTFGNNEESIGSLRGRLQLLLSENHQLRDMLTDKIREIKGLSLQVSKATEKISEQSLAEAQLLKTNANLKSSVEDAHIEALIIEDAFSCILRGMMDQIKHISEKSPVEAAHYAQPVSQCEIEDLNMEYIIMQEICEVVFKEALKEAEVEYIIMQELSEVVYKEALNEAEEELNNLNMKYIDENELRSLLEMENLEKGKKLEVEIANKERLKQEVCFLAEEKEHLAQDATAALEKEKERYDITVQELDNLRGEICQQQKLISESSEDSNATKNNLNKALEQIERQKADMCKLDQNLELAMKELREANGERRMLLDVSQERQNVLSLVESKERELKKQLESTAVYICGLLKAVTDFESRVQQDISVKCSRLKSLSSQSRLLKQKANVLVRRGTMYKKSLEKKCSDLEKAESEVDLLGDEVDTLLSLVEKIYIALDHYSPILQHYPGVTEILKLIRRELSGAVKPARSARFATNSVSGN